MLKQKSLLLSGVLVICGVVVIGMCFCFFGFWFFIDFFFLTDHYNSRFHS